MSPTGSIPNLSSNTSIGSVNNHWNSTNHLPQGHSTPAGPSPNTDSLKRQAAMASIEEHRPTPSTSTTTTTTTNLFQGYFPSSAGYMQVSFLLLLLLKRAIQMSVVIAYTLVRCDMSETGRDLPGC